MDLRERQRPIKDRYAKEPDAAQVTLKAKGSEASDRVSCNVDIGRAVVAAQAHAGVGGPGTGACSGDLLLAALAACSQITAQLVAEAMELPVSVEVNVEGDLDLRGTLGISRHVPVGFSEIRLNIDVDGPITPEQLASFQRKVERYCVVLQTLKGSANIVSSANLVSS